MTRIHKREFGRTVFIRGVFEDFDDFACATTNWESDFRQLDRGASPVEAVQIVSDRTHIMRFRFERRYEQRGSPPARTLNFGIPGDGEPLRWCAEEVPPASLLCFAPGNEFAAVSHAGFTGTTLSFDPDFLARIADDLGLSFAMEGIDVQRLLAGGDPLAIRRLRGGIDRLVALTAHHSQPVPESTFSTLLDEDIPVLLLQAIASTQAPAQVRRPAARVRDRARRLAVALIDAHAHEAPTVRQICRATAVSWRTLDYAFKEHFGVTPKDYLQTVRLHGVRRELRRGDAETVIADVANRWGFWHMGQFAADYRLKFGELPSVTIGYSQQAVGAGMTGPPGGPSGAY